VSIAHSMADTSTTHFCCARALCASRHTARAGRCCA
jgi:hypothetical protein